MKLKCTENFVLVFADSQSLDDYLPVSGVDGMPRSYYMYDYLRDTKQSAYDNDLLHRGIAIARRQGWMDWHIEAQAKWPPFGIRLFQIYI